MPSSVPLWAGGFSAEIRDDARGLLAARRRADKNPLGSAAGYGVPVLPRGGGTSLSGQTFGTGMVIDDQGHILTNNHVVAGATEINVLLADGKSFPAKLVGTDPKTDLAVIRISTDEKLPAVTFGDSDKTAVGDWVVAIGHPRGLDQTVTQGIISAKHRRGILDPSSYQDYLQTDAAINPGNSGGPATGLVISDSIPANTAFAWAAGDGVLVGDRPGFQHCRAFPSG